MNFLVEQYETRGGGLCGRVFDVLASKSGAPKAFRILTTLGNPRVEVELSLYDFIVGLPPTQRKNNVIWVIVDQLTKTAQFIAMRNT